MITHSPLKNKKKENNVMFSPTGVREDDGNKMHKRKPKGSLDNLLENNVKKFITEDQYSFSFLRLLEVEYDISEFDPYRFIATLPPHKPFKKNFCIPKKAEEFKNRNTLVLDLDETLVHCATIGMRKSDLVFPVFFNGDEYRVYVKHRPFFAEFLEFCSQHFEVVVFTASHKSYASKLLNLIDKRRKLIHHRVYRDSCIQVDGNYLKDLSVLGRDIKKVVIVDNSPTAFGYHLNNGIPIVSWYEDMKDNALIKLFPLLEKLSKADDVRPIIKEKFQFKKLIKEYKKKLGIEF